MAVKTVLRGRTGVAVGASGGGKEVERLHREVRIMRKLPDGHPNIALLIAGGVERSAQIASGLAAAHTVGVVDRDLKPANGMLTADGPSRSSTSAWDRSPATRTGPMGRAKPSAFWT